MSNSSVVRWVGEDHWEGQTPEGTTNHPSLHRVGLAVISRMNFRRDVAQKLESVHPLSKVLHIIDMGYSHDSPGSTTSYTAEMYFVLLCTWARWVRFVVLHWTVNCGNYEFELYGKGLELLFSLVQGTYYAHAAKERYTVTQLNVAKLTTVTSCCVHYHSSESRQIISS